MGKYIVELDCIANDDYNLPKNLQRFEISAKDMDESIIKTLNRLEVHMLNRHDYSIDSSHNHDDDVEIRFSDSIKGLDVCYIIKKIS